MKLIVIFVFCKSPQWVAAVKMIVHQSQPVLKLAPPAVLMHEKPHFWGACGGADQACRRSEVLAGFLPLACRS